MFRSKLIGSLGTLQGLLLVAKGFLHLVGIDLSWVIVLAPLWFLLFLATVFWVLCGLLARFLVTHT